MKPGSARPLAISFALMLMVALAVLVVACSPSGGGTGGGGASPAPSTPGPSAPTPTSAPTPAPAPTPITVDVTGPEDAAALVIATDTRFAGTIRLDPNLIGASRWWEWEPLAGGGFRIKITIGWGDCPAGCISRHTWIFQVTADGQVSLESEGGDPLPAGSLPNG